MLKLSEDSLPHEEPVDDLRETGPLVLGGLSHAPGLCPPGKLTIGEFELFSSSSFSSLFFLLLLLDLELELDDNGIELELSSSCFCVAVVVVLEPFKPNSLVSFIDILEACVKDDPDAEDPDAEETGVSATPFQEEVGNG